MLLSVGAFGIYLITHIVSFAITILLYIEVSNGNKPEKTNLYKNSYCVVYIIWITSQAISQILLDIIFWELGEVQAEESEVDLEETYATVETEVFDEEAEF